MAVLPEYMQAAHIVVADKTGGKFAGGAAVELFRAGVLLDAPLVEQHHLVGHGQGFFLVVGHKNGGELQFFLDIADLAAQAFADAGVQCRQRLVQQQQLWLHHQPARQGHALFLAAGQRRRFLFGAALQFHQFQHFLHFSGAHVGRQFFDFQAEFDVFHHIHIGK